MPKAQTKTNDKVRAPSYQHLFCQRDTQDRKEKEEYRRALFLWHPITMALQEAPIRWHVTNPARIHLLAAILAGAWWDMGTQWQHHGPIKTLNASYWVDGYRNDIISGNLGNKKLFNYVVTYSCLNKRTVCLLSRPAWITKSAKVLISDFFFFNSSYPWNSLATFSSNRQYLRWRPSLCVLIAA